MISPIPPYGFETFVMNYEDDQAPAPALVLPDSEIGAVEEINRYWNDNLSQFPMREYQAMPAPQRNRWDILQPGQTGWCHSIAATKRHALLSRYNGALSLAACHVPDDPDDIDHLVLLVNFVSGIRVADSLNSAFWPIGDTDYTWLCRQTWGNPQQWEPVN
jgi:predicted transglutaminase-like cysteine proteinase